MSRLISVSMSSGRRGIAGMGSALLIASVGCQHAGGPNGTAVAPITQLPGQAPVAGPTLPALGPFGASARVPPPATGSYGNPNAVAGSAIGTTPASYAPTTLQPMSFNQPSVAAPASGNQIALAGGTSSAPAGSGWTETSSNQSVVMSPQMNLSGGSNSGGSNSLRTGGMPVNDLTNAPPPPGYSGGYGYNNQAGQFVGQSGSVGYQPPANSPGQYPATQLQPNPTFSPIPQQSPSTQPVNPNAQSGWNSTSPQGAGSALSPTPAPPNLQPYNPADASQPMSGGGYADAAPAANQPAFSSADRPVQWQTPRR
ncbi:putative secreted protein [Rhodopirellula sallentina SM41]|uniref:Putative secreted protein n=1 Tax=Rhodopirellula sallentina SM41 TaxID=1263870 RepID=M5U9U9_9BACT|nr:putative secreted protein [Rhodopirellula sallentina SM41]